MLELILILLAVLAFIAIVLEDVVHINKAKSTLFLGTLSWILLFIGAADHESIEIAFSENILDIASLWLFLFAAMTFVVGSAAGRRIHVDFGKTNNRGKR